MYRSGARQRVTSKGGKTNEGCYLYDYLLAHGEWKGKLPVISRRRDSTTWVPTLNSAFGLRDQWTPNVALWRSTTAFGSTGKTSSGPETRRLNKDLEQHGGYRHRLRHALERLSLSARDRAAHRAQLSR